VTWIFFASTRNTDANWLTMSTSVASFVSCHVEPGWPPPYGGPVGATTM
jgi:hypothetical protein